MLALDGGHVRSFTLPAPDEELLPGVPWGGFDVTFTPAFWAGRAWLAEKRRAFENYALGTTLREEVAACLLGGFGIRAEIGVAAFLGLKAAGLLAPRTSAEAIEAHLSMPLDIEGRRVRYRFPRQKASYLSVILDRLPDDHDLPADDLAFRASLATLRGVGLKTASWITRNWRRSDLVAILDVHICRACIVAGVFDPGSNPARDYLDLEQRFLRFASAIGVRPSILDNLIWQVARRLPVPSLSVHEPETLSKPNVRFA